MYHPVPPFLLMPQKSLGLLGAMSCCRRSRKLYSSCGTSVMSCHRVHVWLLTNIILSKGQMFAASCDLVFVSHFWCSLIMMSRRWGSWLYCLSGMKMTLWPYGVILGNVISMACIVSVLRSAGACAQIAFGMKLLSPGTLSIISLVTKSCLHIDFRHHWISDIIGHK